MTTHSGILAWGILWTEEPGGLQGYSSWGHKRATDTFNLPDEETGTQKKAMTLQVTQRGGNQASWSAPGCWFGAQAPPVVSWALGPPRERPRQPPSKRNSVLTRLPDSSTRPGLAGWEGAAPPPQIIK